LNPVTTEAKFDKKIIPSSVCKTIKRLNKEGFSALIVGGFLRDCLANINAKDFDLVTNAKPEQIRKIFKNSRIVGRRFPIVHVYDSNRSFIEVSTFRSGQSVSNDDGFITRDRSFGTIEQDVVRRDFTINSLYYNYSSHTLIDFLGGANDIKDKVIRSIGDPLNRFKEDPVRILRALRFQAKLDATIDKSTEEAIEINSSLLINISPSRLFDEIIKLFHSRDNIKIIELILSYKIDRFLFTELNNDSFLRAALENTAMRIEANSSISPIFIFSVFLWSLRVKKLKKISNSRKLNSLIVRESDKDVLLKQNKLTNMPKWIKEGILDLWSLQHRLEKSRNSNILSDKRFRMAYDFLVLRSETINPNLRKTVDYWTKIQ